MTNEDLPEVHYAIVHYDEEDYHFMPIVSDVFAEAVAEHLGDYRDDITTYISTEQPEFDLEEEHPELYDDLTYHMNSGKLKNLRIKVVIEKLVDRI